MVADSVDLAAAGLVAAVVTGWPVGIALAAAGGFWVPSLLGSRSARGRRQARLEGLASWTEQLRDVMAAAAAMAEQEDMRRSLLADLEAAVPALRQIAGNIAMPGFTAPKLAWVRRHEPEFFAQVRTVLLPKDYVRLYLTGEKASDLSDSAGTLWLDVAQRDWSDELLAATGLTRAHMPQLFEGTQPTGTLRVDVAADWGMAPVPVAAGGGDNAAGAVGVGTIGEGDALLSLGTSGVIFVANQQFRPNPAGAVHAFCHCLPGMWHQMAVHLSAASCIDWGARQLSLAGPAEFFTLAETAIPGAAPELFLPYLSGERTPHNDPHIRAAFLACDGDTTPARLASAVLEGVAFAHADGVAALRAGGSVIERLNVRAPRNGTILQLHVRAGEWAGTDPKNPSLILGRTDLLQTRVDIDEQNAVRIQKNQKAIAHIKGDSEHPIELKLEYIEPFVVPKMSLTGSSTERVDTRVLQVIYRLKVPANKTLYVGQQVDVFIGE